MVALKIRAPVAQDLFEPAILEVRRGQFFWDKSKADALDCSVESMDDAVENKLAFDFDAESLAVLFEFPLVNSTARSVTYVHSSMIDQIVRCRGR